MTKSLLGEDKIKCMWCEDARKNNVFTDGGSQSPQLASLNEHSKSSDHVIASVMYHAKIQNRNANVKGPMDEKISEMMHSEYERIVLCMKLVHFYACDDIPLEKYAKQVKLQRELGAPNAPASNEYGAYANAISAREFLMAIKNHTKESLV